MHNANWDDLRFVLAVADAGSVNAATTRLGVNHATVLRRVGRFERQHGVTIFTRSAAGYAVDPACRPVIEAIRAVAGAADGVERALARRDKGVTGPLRLTTTDTLANTVLPRIMIGLRALHPGLRIELAVTNVRLDLARMDAELTIRPARELPPELTGTRVCSMVMAPYGTPEDLARLDAGDSPRWIGIAGPLGNSPLGIWQANLDPDLLGCTASSFPAMAEMAAEGLGLAMLPCCLGDRTRGLRRATALGESVETGIWVACHPDLQDVPRVSAVSRYLVDALGQISPVLEGRGEWRPA